MANWLIFACQCKSLMGRSLLMSAGKTAEEEPLFSTHEPRTPEDHPRAGRGLLRGERELRQRAQTQRGHHSPKVRPQSDGKTHMNTFANTSSLDTLKTSSSVDCGFEGVCSFSGGSRSVRTRP